MLFFTHCCAKKDARLKSSDKRVSPLHLYQAAPTQRFMKRCIGLGVDWAIFSDKYGFVFPNDQIQWYEKHPNSVTQSEKRKLFDDALVAMHHYDLAYLYYNPGRIHPFYRELVSEMQNRGRKVRELTHLTEILKR